MNKLNQKLSVDLGRRKQRRTFVILHWKSTFGENHASEHAECFSNARTQASHARRLPCKIQFSRFLAKVRPDLLANKLLFEMSLLS